MALADWDARLLSPEQGLKLAGDWPVYATCEYANLEQFGDQPGRWQVNLRCRKCEQSCGLLGAWSDYPGTHNPQPLDGSESSIEDLLSGVLRHLVTAHNLILSGAGRELPPEPPVGPLVISPPEDHARFIDAITEMQEQNGH